MMTKINSYQPVATSDGVPCRSAPELPVPAARLKVAAVEVAMALSDALILPQSAASRIWVALRD